jgi:hypothetical protein
MTRTTRYFMLGAAGILVAGLCTGLVAYYGGFSAGVLSQARVPEELQYVPSDAAVVAYANVRDVMTSELRQRLQDLELHGQGGRETFAQRTGIDVESDVDVVVASLLPGEGDGNAVVVIRGRFNDVRLESLAREHGGTAGEHRGVRVIARAEGNPNGALAFLAPGLIAVGGDAAIRRAIDVRLDGQNITDNSDIMTLIGDIDGGTNAWAVGRFEAIASRAKLPEGVAAQVPAIQWFTASGRVNGGVTGVFRAEARDEEAAASLRDVLRGFLALVKLQAGSKPELQAMMQSLELGGTGRTVALSFSISPQVFESLAPRARQPAEP